jgi:hypothetical protein
VRTSRQVERSNRYRCEMGLAFREIKRRKAVRSRKKKMVKSSRERCRNRSVIQFQTTTTL